MFTFHLPLQHSLMARVGPPSAPRPADCLPVFRLHRMHYHSSKSAPLCILLAIRLVLAGCQLERCSTLRCARGATVSVASWQHSFVHAARSRAGGAVPAGAFYPVLPVHAHAGHAGGQPLRAPPRHGCQPGPQHPQGAIRHPLSALTSGLALLTSSRRPMSSVHGKRFGRSFCDVPLPI